MTFADSSFILAIYVEDQHTLTARTYMANHPHPLALNAFSRSEAEHALRLMAFRGVISSERMTQHLLFFEQDQADGIFENVPLDTSELFAQTSKISRQHAVAIGLRYLDTLHLAGALAGGGKRFLSFDDRQRRVAREVGLEVGP